MALPQIWSCIFRCCITIRQAYWGLYAVRSRLGVSGRSACHSGRCARAEQGLKRCWWINNRIDRRTVWRSAVEPWLPVVRLRGSQLVRVSLLCGCVCGWMWYSRDAVVGILSSVRSTSKSVTPWLFSISIIIVIIIIILSIIWKVVVVPAVRRNLRRWGRFDKSRPTNIFVI